MEDILLKSVKITDNIKVDVYQQGRKRKYVLFNDSNATRSQKYDISLTDNQAIEEALIYYNQRYGSLVKSYKVIQDPYNESNNIEQISNTLQQAAINDIPSATQSVTKIKLTIDGLSDSIQIKLNEDLPLFTVWTGPIPKSKELIDQFDDLFEYSESDFQGSEEARIEFESPSYISEVDNSFNFKSDDSAVSTYELDPNYKPGNIVSLPRDYSHTTQQGYNLLNSKWIGDLITSAKSHIGHPTYDIEGTDKGNLGCASAVSMIFYRAFGVHMKTGKSVKEKPTDIGSFGTKGTAEAAGWFQNASLYRRINWLEAQPGDIINTARNFDTNKAGHIGVVIDKKDSDGSWAIVSNSSKGFAGGGGGAIKQNYSVKKWQSVANRNPAQTFAFRYIGPKNSIV